MPRKKLIHSALTSAVIFVMVCCSWYVMFARANGEAFASRGLRSLKYFTVDSNLLMAAAALINTVCIAEVWRGRKSNVPGWAELLFYAGTTSVSLTFGMVMAYLGPAFGYGNMLASANLYFHLIVPVLSICAWCLLHREQKISFRQSFLALIPLFLYGVYYIGMIIRYGLDRPRADWYWLAVGGIKWIPLVFLLIVVCTWGMALLLRLAVNGRPEK